MTAKRPTTKTNMESSFEQATASFFDPLFKLVDASANQETRDAVIGFDEFGSLLFVVHIAVEDEFIRIISARKATPTDTAIKLRLFSFVLSLSKDEWKNPNSLS